MTYLDLINYIKYSEISTLSFIKDLSDPLKREESQKRLLTYIHLGLIDLNNIFHLKTLVEKVDTYPEVYMYQTRSKNRGLLLGVYDEHGDELEFPTLLDDDDSDIQEINAGSYMLKHPKKGELFFVYSSVGSNPSLDEEVDIPDVFLEALILFVAQKGMATMATNSVNTNENKQILFSNKYKEKVEELKMLGYGKTSHILSFRVQDRGFI